ncbi:hypothetical protein HUJ04_012005 [Dendroctonus ponderosae]|nr:hypothetical protein HUJ04_012005 [Dendroctonus ponderosae]KAH1029113.1 hypothetical protein HUJ05_002412 [Dendroctonus ponderosae]
MGLLIKKLNTSGSAPRKNNVALGGVAKYVLSQAPFSLRAFFPQVFVAAGFPPDPDAPMQPIEPTAH